MDQNFWHQKWQNNQLGFHQSEINSALVNHFDELGLEKNSCVFVPLCGKTRDIFWLLSKGYFVIGAELSELAVEQLFVDLRVKPVISNVGQLKRYSAKNIDIYVGDIFELTIDIIGKADGVYDRAALVALPKGMRDQYAKHLIEFAPNSPQLLVCFEYDQSLMDGPPFSIDEDEVHRLYKAHYTLSLLSRVDLDGGLKGKHAAIESAWWLH